LRGQSPRSKVADPAVFAARDARADVDPFAVLCYGKLAGIVGAMKTQKVTVHVDQALLRRARKRTGEGVSATIRHGLTLVAAGAAYEKLRALRGRVKFSVNLRALREDRA
jgi:hypothetical protein